MNTRALFAALTGLALAWGSQAMAGPVPAPMPAPSAYQWTGMYFGAHVGGGWAAKDWTVLSGSENTLTERLSGAGLAMACLAAFKAE